MPDAQGNFLGDRATVLPSNENALLHFSNLFAQKEAQRRAQRLAQAKADQERRIGLQKYLGDKLTSKDFHTNSTYQGIINSGLEDITANAQKLINEVPEDQVYAYLNQALPAVRQKANKANELDANLASQAADFKLKHPDADIPALISVARANASYKTDADGNPVIKDLSTEVDPTHPWLQEAYDKNPENFFSPDAISNAWNKAMKEDKPKEVNEIPAYDEKQNMTNIPFKGKVPSFAAVVKDSNGKVLWDENTGAPKVDIPGSHYYRVDGEDYRDDQGRKVKVVDDNTFGNFYHGAIKADIEKQVKKVLSNGDFEPDSEYADMLRKSLLYDKLKDKAVAASSFTNLEGKSFERQNAAERLRLAKIQAGISQQRLAISKEKLTMDKLKDANGAENAPVPATDKIAEEHGEILPASKFYGDPIKIVRVKDIDPATLRNILGTKYTQDGNPVAGTPQPITDAKGDYFIVGDEGSWFGQNSQRIDRAEAYRRQLSIGDKGTPNIEPPPPKKNIIQKTIDRVKQKITPVKKIKGTDQKLF